MPAPRLPIVPGQRIGKLVVVRRAKRRYFHALPSGYREPNHMWLCLCDCGRDIFLSTSYINDAARHGINKSCKVGQCRARGSGLFSGFNRIRNKRTGSSYNAMLRRCLNHEDSSYKNYGACGITICPQWQGPDGLRQFIADVGLRPRGKSLDRKNPFGNYEPGNCRWATPKEQGNNHRLQYAAAHPDDPLVIAGLEIEAGRAEETFKGQDWKALEPVGF